MLQFLNNLQKVKRKRKALPFLYDKCQLNTSKSFSISCPGYLPFILETVVISHDSKSVLTHSTFTVASVLGQFLRLKRGKVQALSCKSTQSQSDKIEKCLEGSWGTGKRHPQTVESR